jgi:hypothetical protein
VPTLALTQTRPILNERNGLVTSVISFRIGHGETIVFAARIFEETMHTLTEWGIPYFLSPGVAVGILAVLLDPWRKAMDEGGN